jgi:hypothetical protein
MEFSLVLGGDTDRQEGDLISFLLFIQNKQSGLKIVQTSVIR